VIGGSGGAQRCDAVNVVESFGAPFVKTLYLTDLAQKLHLAISAQRQLSLRAFSYLYTHLAFHAHI